MITERSRYAGLPLREHVLSDGRRAVYVLPRIAPPPETLQTAARHTVTDSDRLDGLAYRHLGDPGAWWLIADANRAAHPGEILAEAGRTIAIPLPSPKGRFG